MKRKIWTGQKTVQEKMKPKVEQFFRDHGCELLDEYVNDTTKVNFLCKCGNKGFKSYDKFKCRPYCKVCGKNMVTKENHYFYNPDKEYKRKRHLINISSSSKLKNFWNNKSLKTTQGSIAKFGYGPKEFQDHIKSHPNFTPTFEKISFDHIFPICAFLEHGIEDLKIINHLSNIQPVEFKENLRKGYTYNKMEFYNWLDSIGYINYTKKVEDN